jgi:hypothetical protein
MAGLVTGWPTVGVVLAVGGPGAVQAPVRHLTHWLQHREGGEGLEAILGGEAGLGVGLPVPGVLPVVVVMGVAPAAAVGVGRDVALLITGDAIRRAEEMVI